MHTPDSFSTVLPYHPQVTGLYQRPQDEAPESVLYQAHKVSRGVQLKFENLCSVSGDFKPPQILALFNVS